MAEADPELAVRDYLRADATVNGLIGNRIFFGAPRNGAPTTAFATVRRVAGQDDLSEAPLDLSQLQIDCWGQKATQGPGGSKASANALRAAVRGALREIRGTTTQGSTVLYGANVIGDVWAPDPESDRPRYVVTAEVTARAA